MSNSLTGDFEAVLQVSGGTVNRLMASMHQNPIAQAHLPTFPHSPTIRIGDDRMVDGVRGTVKVQIGAPRIELIHGVSDRFLLEVYIRARYKPDAGTTPLPEFIHGVVRAEYRIQNIDRGCLGWSKNADDYIWVRVIRSTVKFTGTAFDDSGPWLQTQGTGAQVESLITRQVARQLTVPFAPGPHPVGKRFRPGLMRSLSALNGSAVCLPIAISGEPVGSVASIHNILLDGRDFAIALSRETLLSLINPAVSAIGSYATTVKIHVSTPWPMPDIDTVYRARVNPPAVEWHPQGHYAIVKIKASGSARTDSILADATFDVEQDIVVNFDGGGPVLWLSAGYHNVTVHASGLGHGTVANAVKNAVSSAVKAMVQSVCANAQPELEAMIGRKQELIDQLRTIDDASDARVDSAQFVVDGMVLRGVITLSARQQPVIRFDETIEGDGYSAFLSWIPGGRIDQFVWNWTWFGTGKPGSANLTDRFLLRRPRTTKISRWGAAVGFEQSVRLPGLDGMGTLCLTIKGSIVDRHTGAPVPFVARKQCSRYGFPIFLTPAEGTRLLWRTWPLEPELSQDIPFPELAILDISHRQSPGVARAANTLLLYVDRAWDREVAVSLQDGFDRSRRRDATLQVMVLFREGVLTHSLAARVETLSSSIGAHVLVNEDVRQTWSKRYDIPTGSGELAWRLISPHGGVTWMHTGRMHGEALAQVLDQALIPSKTSKASPVHSSPGIGSLIVADALRIDLLEFLEVEAEPRCPPVPLNRLKTGSVVVFVQSGSVSSESQLRELRDRYGRDREDQPFVAVVVDGADARQAEGLKREFGLDEFAVLPDSKGNIARRFGVHMWPASLSLDSGGVVSAVELGARRDRQDPEEMPTPPLD